MGDIRRFALVIVDDMDNEVNRFNLDYADNPKNLGFELEFTTLESNLTTYFTRSYEKRLPTTLNLNFIPPNAYEKANAFKRFVQKYLNKRMVFEYYDTEEVKHWEGKIQKFGQEERLDWGGLVCPISFLPGTPKYIRKDNAIFIQSASTGKNYSYKYPYSYGKLSIQNNTINNTYFDEIPLRITLYGKMSNPQVSLQDSATGEVYSSVRFEGIQLLEDEYLVLDAIRSKVQLYKGGSLVPAYDYISKKSSLDSFLYARGDTVSKVLINLDPEENGYLRASYRQYTL